MSADLPLQVLKLYRNDESVLPTIQVLEGGSMKFPFPSASTPTGKAVRELVRGDGNEEYVVDGKMMVGYREGAEKKYSLLAIYYYIKFAKYTENFKACKVYGVTAVKADDRGAIREYLDGKEKKKSSSKDGRDKEKEKARERDAERARKKVSGKDKKKKKQDNVSKDRIQQHLRAEDKGGEKEEQHFAFLEVGDLSAKGDKVEENRSTVTKIIAFETPVATTTALLKSTDPTKDLNVALRHFESSKPKGKRSREERNTAGASRAKKIKLTGNPIIVVPNAMTATINMANAEQFFGKATYMDSNAARRAKGYSKKKKVEVKRTIGKTNTAVTFEIIDDAKMLPREDWNRVVAVLTQGKEWQFKGWHKTNPVDVFNHAFGFHVYIEGTPIPEMLGNWNVKISKISRDKRGLDSVTHSQFWTNLEAWMKVNRPTLFD